MKGKPRFDPGPRQEGIALIAVLLLLVFILTIVGGLFYRHQIHIQKVTRTFVGEQALLLLLSAESWAKSVLEEDVRQGPTDHLEEVWARSLPVLPMEGGQITGCLQDLQGLFNINSLAWYSNKSWSDELEDDYAGKTSRRRVLASLMTGLELDSSDARIAAVVDWLDADAWLLSPESAEDNEYLLADPPYRAANQSFAELSELSLVQGFAPADALALGPWVNTVSADTAINVNTAPARVLAALSPRITEAHAEALMELRPYDTVGTFYTELAGVVGEPRQTLMAAIPEDFVSVASDWFALRARVKLAGVEMTYSSIIHRPGPGDSRVLRRTLRHIPPMARLEGEAPSPYTDCTPGGEAQETP